MKKRLLRCAALLCLLGSVLLITAVAAPVSEDRVFDQANLLTEVEEQKLEQSISRLQDKIGIDLVLVTTDDLNGLHRMQYADNYYDDGGFGRGPDRSGVLYLLDMENRIPYLSTCGKMIDRLTDQRIESIHDVMFDELARGDYYAALNRFLGEIRRYTVKSLSLGEILLFLVIAAGAGLIACLIVAAKYKLRIPAYTYPFREKSGMVLTQREDVFVNRTHTQHRIQTSSPSSGGGRSSTHRSSGGVRHGGGGGRKF